MRNGPGSLNRIYRLVWNEATQAWVAVAELTRSRGKRSSGTVGALAVSALLTATAAYAVDPPPVNALPTGGAVAAGIASIGQSGNTMNIVQGSDRAAINWQTFNIGANASVNFQQPSASSMILNRVMSADPSAIFGSLTANGQVTLVNPNGIVFGPGSRVDVGGLVASSLAISNADFMAGRLNFARGDATGAVTNKGTLTAATQGYIAMLAPEVRNEGIISARMGTVALAAGDAVTLDMSGTGLMGVRVDAGTLNTLVENRHMVHAEGGQVILSAGAANRLLQQAVAGHGGASQLVEIDGKVRLVNAGGDISASGGQVRIEGSTVSTQGSIDVSGAQAGNVNISGDFVAQSGAVKADAGTGAGGRIEVSGGSVIQTASTLLSADGAAGGGRVNVTGANAADKGTVYSSATISARGTGASADGGRVDITAGSVQLRAATVDASGQGNGGHIRVGGGFRGLETDIANAGKVGVNASTELIANAGVNGDGGKIAVWADGTTLFGGGVTARGGSASGNGGRAEVSGKQNLGFEGRVDLSAANGRAGQFELDPHDIIIDNVDAVMATLSLDDPNGNADRNNHFAAHVTVLPNGNVVITAPNTTVGSASSAGAAYLFNSRTGSLLNQLYGANSDDHVGSSGIYALDNSNYLVLSPYFNRIASSSSVNFFARLSDFRNYSQYTRFTTSEATAGAITWQNGSPAGSTGTGGGAASSVTVNTSNIVSASNSLVGNNSTFDRVGQVNGTIVDAVVSASPDPILRTLPSTTTLTKLTDGNVVVSMPDWNEGRGSVTLINAANGQLGNGAAGGVVSASNSLVGSTGLRATAITETSGGHNFFVTDFRTTAPTLVTRYVEPFNNFQTETVTPAVIGAGDRVGEQVTALAGGNFAVLSPLWTNGAAAYAGAVTWGGSGNLTGAVSASNSLVGTMSYAAVGSGGVKLLGTPATGQTLAPNYLVLSPYWNPKNGFVSGGYQGAITWVNGATGAINGTTSVGGAVSAANSLVGSTTGDGDSITTQQKSSGNRITHTIVATGSGNTTQFASQDISGVRAEVDAQAPLLLDNGNVLNLAPIVGTNVGAVTLIKADGTLGNGALAVGQASSSNSLVGAQGGNFLGAGTPFALAGKRFVFKTGNSGAIPVYIAVVDGDDGQIVGAATGTIGATLSSSNSLTGAAFDRVGSGGIFGVGGKDTQGRYDNFIVLSPYWGSTTAAGLDSKGAVTWVSGATGLTGNVGGTNSLVGSNAGDFVGGLVSSVTRIGNSAGNTGLINFSTGYIANPQQAVDVLNNGNYVVRSPHWASSKGAATWVDGTTGVANGASGTGAVVGSGNSLVGSTARVLTTNTVTRTHADGNSFNDTTTTEVSVGDFVGLGGRGLSNGAYVLSSPFWNEGRGAATWISPIGQLSSAAGGGAAVGAVATGNSLTGTLATSVSGTQLSGTAGGDASLAGGVSLLPVFGITGGDAVSGAIEATGYFKIVESVLASNANSGTTNSKPLLPFALASKFGYTNNTGKLTGYTYFASAPAANVLDVSDSDFFAVGSGTWNNGSAVDVGALTFGRRADGLPVAAVGTGNSLVGTNNYDRIGRSLTTFAFAGSTGVKGLTGGNLLVLSPGWGNDSTEALYQPHTGKGAITWLSGTGSLAGEVSASTSLVGSTAQDNIGSGGVTVLSDGNVVVSSFQWSNGTEQFAGAVTRIPAATGLTGVVSESNSLVGSTAFDFVGSGGVRALTDGSYIVSSSNWSNGTASNAGAVSYGAAGTGVTGRISAANSLVGTQTFDFVGGFGVTVLPNNGYIVQSPFWNNGDKQFAGAVTYGAPGVGVSGVISEQNSLIGSVAGDQVGSGGVTLVRDQANTFTNAFISSPNWSDYNTNQANVGAVTWINGATGRTYGQTSGTASGRVNALNSLVGTTPSQQFGQSLQATQVSISGVSQVTGDAIIFSSGRTGDSNGSVTLLPGQTGLAGYVNSRNSVLGFNDSNSGVGFASFTMLPYSTTSLEKVAYRPLVWTPVASFGSGRQSAGANADNARGVLAMSLLAESATHNTDGSLGRDASSVAAGDGLDWRTTTQFLSDVNALTAYGYSGGVLPFSAGNNGGDAVITPSAIQAILNAGTDLTLQANNNITVLKAINVSNTNGNGGNLTLQAGRSVRLLASVTTDNGDLTIKANESVSAGVSAAHADSSLAGPAQIVMGDGVTIDAGTGRVSLTLSHDTSKTKTLPTATRSSGVGPFTYTFGTTPTDSNSSGNIVLGSINAGNLTVLNQGGQNTVSGFGHVFNNAAGQIALQKTGTADGVFNVSAHGSVVLGKRTATQTVRVALDNTASGELDVILNADNSGSQGGAVSLTNAEIATGNGDIVIGGGTADSNGRPTASASAASVNFRDSGSVSLHGVTVEGASVLNAGNGIVKLAGSSSVGDRDGVHIEGASAGSPVTVNGSRVTLDGTYASSGTNSGIGLSKVTIGGAGTQQVDLLASGFSGSSNGSIDLNGAVTFVAATGSVLNVASSNPSGAATFGGSTAPASGLWVKDENVTTLLAAATVFADVNLGSSQQSGVTSLKALDLATQFGSTPAPFNLTVSGGAGGLSVDGNVTQGLAADKVLKLEVANGGTLNLGTSAITSDKVLLAASGAGSQVTQASGSFITTPSLRLDAADADVNLDQINQFTTVAGTIGQGKVVTGQTLTVGTTQGVSGLTSNGDVLVRTIGTTSDLQVDQAITSTNGNITAVTERNFFNTVAGDQGLQTPAGRYLVYSAAPVNLPSSAVSGRGMSAGFSKHYAQSFTGTTPAYAGTGNWFFYANTPTITVAPGSGSSVYGAATSTGAVSVTGLIDGDAESDALTGTPIVSGGTFTASGAGHRPVGSYNVRLTGLGTLSSPMGYAINLSSGTGTLTVTPLDVTLSGSRVYDRTGVVSGTSLNQVVGALSGDAVAANTALQATVSDPNVGNGKALTFTNAFRLSGADAGNYNVTGGTVDITSRPVTVTANARTKVYGESDPSLTFTAQNATGNQGLVSGDSFSGALSRASGETVNGGPYAISQGTLANSNYTISFTGNSLTITPRPVNVTGDAKTKVYGENDPLFTFTSEVQSAGRGLKTGDTLSGALTRASGETVNGGPYAITRGTLANSNYTISFSNGALTITPRPINLTADDKSKVYGENDPSLTFTSEAQSAGRGLKTGDTFTGALTRANGETVDGGPYTITQGTVANSNYAISFANGALTITPRPVEVIADFKSKVYGEADPALTFVAETQTAGRGLKTGDTFTGALTRASGENVSSTGYAISQGSLANTNYDISVIGSFLQITPRPVNVTADNKTKVYGDADPTLTFVAEGVSAGRGLKAGDVLTGAPVRAAGETVAGGPYSIGQGTVDNANYAVNFINGALTITRRPLTVTADDKERLFGDKDPEFTFSVNPTQLAFTDTANVVRGVEYQTRRGIAVPPGDYPIVISAGSADNYQLTFVDGELTVKPVAMIRSENLIVQQGPQSGGLTSAPAPSVTTPSANAPTVASAQPGMLAVRDGGLSAGAAPTMTAATAAPASMGLAPATGSFQVAVVTRPAGGADGLIANTPIPQARVDVGTAFKVEIPQSAFASTRADAKVTLSATAADGSALPSWVKFDAQSGKVEGTAPAGFKGDLAVKVVARDERGNEAVQTLTISVGK